MKRLIIRFKWWLFGLPPSVHRKRVREELASLGYEAAWVNWYYQAREKE